MTRAQPARVYPVCQRTPTIMLQLHTVLRSTLTCLALILVIAGCSNQPSSELDSTPVVLPTVTPVSQDPLVSTLAPTPTAVVTATAGGFAVESTPVQYILAQATVNIRQGPGTDYPVVGQVAAGMIARVVGMNSDQSWWLVICPDETVGDCWVTADPSLTSEAGDGPAADPLEDGPPIHETGDATVESISVRTVESLPIQYQAVLRGYLPDSCTSITDVEQVREATTFRIRMTTQRTQDETCTETTTPFEQAVTLDISGLPLGAYQVAVNELWTSFELSGVVSNQAVYPVVETAISHVTARSEMRIFAGPGSQFARLGRVAAGMMVQVTGSSPDGQWWRVICPDGSVGDCWISADQALAQPVTATPAPTPSPES